MSVKAWIERIAGLEWILLTYGCVVIGVAILVLGPRGDWKHAAVLIAGGAALEAVRLYTNRRQRDDERNHDRFGRDEEEEITDTQ